MQLIALSTLKAYWRRYVAVGLAIMVGAAFLTATLLVQSVSQASFGNSLGENYRGADLVMQIDAEALERTPVSTDGNTAFNETSIAFAKGTSLVSVAQPIGTSSAQLHITQPDPASSSGQRTVIDMASVNIAPSNPEFGSMKIIEGKAPQGAAQVAVPESQAARLKLSIGDTLTLDRLSAKVTGIAANSNDPTNSFGVQVWADLSLVKSLQKEDLRFEAIALKLAPGIQPSTAQGDLTSLAQHENLTFVTFKTPEAAVKDSIARFSGGTDVLTPVLLIFAGVALFVMTLVVSNTFAVIVAQRTRELGLLRTLGADRKQVRRMVRLEALALGLIASILGVTAGMAVMFGLVTWAKTLPGAAYTTFAANHQSIWIPVLVGTILTVLAAGAPARRATNVAPLEALRPQDMSADSHDFAHGSNRGRPSLGLSKGTFAYGLVLFVVGTAALVVFSVFFPNLIIAFLSGIVSLSGVVVLAPVFIPRAVGALGRLTGRKSAPAQLAALNAVRQPRRTSATGTALIIGVALVTMFLTGGTVAKATLDGSVSSQYPVDFSLGTVDPTQTPLTEADAKKLTQIRGIEAAILMQTVGITDGSVSVLAASATDLAKVLNDPATIPPQGSVVVGKELVPGNTLDVLKTDGSSVTVPVVHAGADYLQPMMSTETAHALGLTVPMKFTDPTAGDSGTIYARAAQGLDANSINQLRDDISAAVGIPPMYIGGAAMMRASIGGAIDMLLMIVSGLLAVSILIAVIGVSNTLSLSVIERSQENSLLRALGLTTRQLRSMIAREALLVSVTGAVLGVLLGVGYGLAGAQAAMGSFAPLVISLPWLMLGLVLVGAMIAGLLAAVVPIRRAVRLSPVAGMREAVA
ncbi:ABC transporter permease [Neomicrococcus lactis]